ncbi:hypothetical protein KIL84_003984, partial [Mauremys mutica]
MQQWLYVRPSSYSNLKALYTIRIRLIIEKRLGSCTVTLLQWLTQTPVDTRSCFDARRKRWTKNFTWFLYG